jgi:hypothetical protein
MKNTEIKIRIEKNIRGLAKDERVTLSDDQVAKAAEDISRYLAQRAKHDQLFMLKGNESQDIWDAAKQWFYC